MNRRATIGAALTLVIGMGFGRFAFTGLYPLMVAEGQLTVAQGSFAASVNYAGYLIGALMLGLVRKAPSYRLMIMSMVAGVLLLAALGLPQPAWLIIAVRGLAGVASAVGLVSASQWLIQDRGQVHGAPALFSGVGIGILVSAEAIALGHGTGLGASSIWLLLAAAGLVAALASIVLIRASQAAPIIVDQGTANGSIVAQLSAAPLISIYGLAGFGYIVTATYLPLLVQTALGSIDPVHIWALFGLGAIPSCFFWHACHVRWGTRRSLAANLAIQAIGVALPALTLSPVAFLASAVLVGGTFMGTVTIAMSAARRLAGGVRYNILAITTAAYGVGQILGPLVANGLYSSMGTFSGSLLIAATALVIGAVMCLVGRAALKTSA